MSTRYYIGVDGGGTSTRAIIADKAGRILGTGASGSANRNHYTRDEAKKNLRSTMREAIGSLAFDSSQSMIFLGMSGVSTNRDRQEIEEIAREIPEIGQEACVVVENDTVAGLTGGLAGKPGIALIAGTGSACLGINAHGERWICGGWGALADDVGSAPWIGLLAVQAAVRAEDGRSMPTALQSIVFNYLNLETPRQLISSVHNYELDRSKLGGLAPYVISAYNEGDAAAAEILDQASEELTKLTSVTVAKLFGPAPCDLILVGGLALSGPPFQTILTDRLCRNIPNLRVVKPLFSPVHGAVLEAMRCDNVPWTETLIANLALHGADALACES